MQPKSLLDQMAADKEMGIEGQFAQLRLLFLCLDKHNLHRSIQCGDVAVGRLQGNDSTQSFSIGCPTKLLSCLCSRYTVCMPGRPLMFMGSEIGALADMMSLRFCLRDGKGHSPYPLPSFHSYSGMQLPLLSIS